MIYKSEKTPDGNYVKWAPTLISILYLNEYEGGDKLIKSRTVKKGSAYFEYFCICNRVQKMNVEFFTSVSL